MKQVSIICSYDCLNLQNDINNKLEKLQINDEDVTIENIQVGSDCNGRYMAVIMYDDGVERE